MVTPNASLVGVITAVKDFTIPTILKLRQQAEGSTDMSPKHANYERK